MEVDRKTQILEARREEKRKVKYELKLRRDRWRAEYAAKKRREKARKLARIAAVPLGNVRREGFFFSDLVAHIGHDASVRCFLGLGWEPCGLRVLSAEEIWCLLTAPS